tara:strand:- start:875 stop:1774 length:900 start_codon:yes stop_codon:yes gene_type:complete
MAYNAIGSPRIYVNLIEWLMNNEEIFGAGNLFRTLPVVPTQSLQNPYSFTSPIWGMTSQGFIAVLGHDMNFADSDYALYEDASEVSFNNIVNGSGSGTVPGYDGFSINTFTGSPDINSLEITNNPNLSSIIIGSYYEMPHSPDLNLTLEYSTGTKTIETRGGASLSNTMHRPPMWGNLGQWELNDPGDPTLGQKLAHSSRRSWDLSFSFVDKTDSFSKYNALNTLAEDPNAIDPQQYTLEESDDFFTQVWNRVGTNLPFIFQPDKDVLEFAICKFENDFQAKLVANAVYNTKLKIREVW